MTYTFIWPAVVWCSKIGTHEELFQLYKAHGMPAESRITDDRSAHDTFRCNICGGLVQFDGTPPIERQAMLVTIGRRRLNLFNTTRFDTDNHTVYFLDGSSVQLTEAESEALRIYWDSHAEALDAKDNQNATTPEDGGRDFARGSEMS